MFSNGGFSVRDVNANVSATHPFNDLNLAVKPRRPTLNQGHARNETHVVHMASRGKVIERIEHDVERLEPVHVKPRIHDIRMVRFKLGARFEPMRNFLGDLEPPMSVRLCCFSVSVAMRMRAGM